MRDTFIPFALRHGLLVKAHADWRMVAEPKYGTIKGLPFTWGKLVATDGILCYMLKPDGSLFQGHLASFEPDVQYATIDSISQKPARRLSQKESRLLEMLLR